MSSVVQLIEVPQSFCQQEVEFIQAQLGQLFEAEAQVRRLVFDFAQTRVVDSAAIVYLRQLSQQATAKGVELLGWSLHPQLKQALTLAGVDQHFTFTESTNQVVFADQDCTLDQQVHASVLSKGKRLLDIVGALVGLTITSVLFIPLAIAIKLDSPGPVLFSQTRCGYRGKQFKIWKFRSMVTNAEALKHQVENEIDGAFFKNANDPRITKVGQLLRKTSLDEFPQFWNVLMGEMSLVGTRPPTLDEVAQYEPQQGNRLEVKPGLTGEWQVNGRSTVLSFDQVVEMDMNYQKRWSVGYDLKLIFKTLQVIFSKRSGAC
ncbi:MAG: sugar transferase [Synechocystis sp.]|nr:sugar transferase [Synechocystis sp.]